MDSGHPSPASSRSEHAKMHLATLFFASFATAQVMPNTAFPGAVRTYYQLSATHPKDNENVPTWEELTAVTRIWMGKDAETLRLHHSLMEMHHPEGSGETFCARARRAATAEMEFLQMAGAEYFEHGGEFVEVKERLSKREENVVTMDSGFAEEFEKSFERAMGAHDRVTLAIGKAEMVMAMAVKVCRAEAS
ncbi:hypothetical protein LTR08_004300 [Meristemomyces frigidus]|nr:hypothetical protein LTR08_004300 [Meristemomyces frigidus]